MTYVELKTLIAGYLHRDDLTSMIPTFITLAQSRMDHDLDTTGMQTTDSLTVTGGTKEVTLPTDFLEMLSVRVPTSGGFQALQQRSLVQNSQILEAGGSGTPRYYARYGNTIELTPVPSTTTTLEIVYKQRLTAFSADDATDDILTNHPNIYLYASIYEASLYTQSIELMAASEKMYGAEVITINEQNERAEWSGGPIEIFNMGVDTP